MGVAAGYGLAGWVLIRSRKPCRVVSFRAEVEYSLAEKMAVAACPARSVKSSKSVAVNSDFWTRSLLMEMTPTTLSLIFRGMTAVGWSNGVASLCATWAAKKFSPV